jgi:hypothetical protein
LQIYRGKRARVVVAGARVREAKAEGRLGVLSAGLDNPKDEDSRKMRNRRDGGILTVLEHLPPEIVLAAIAMDPLEEEAPLLREDPPAGVVPTDNDQEVLTHMLTDLIEMD